MTIKPNRSRFDTRRSSHLFAPHTCIEHLIARRGPPSSSSSHSPPSHHHFLTNKYRITHTNHTFFEHNCTYKINHFTIDDDCILIHNQFTSKSANATNYSLPGLNHPLSDANHPLQEHKCINIDTNYAEQETTDCNKSAAGNGTLAALRNVEKLDIDNYVQLPNTTPHCSMDHDEAAAKDNFTFSPSVADSMEFFQFVKSSSGHASEAGERISVMSHADELFKDGKIRPLLPSVISIDGSRNQLSVNDCLSDRRAWDILPSMGSREGSLISPNHETDSGGRIDERMEQKDIDDDQQIMLLDTLPFKFLSLYTPASPVRELLVTNGTFDHNEEQARQGIISPEQSEMITNYHFKRCRSLTQAFPNEDSNEQISEERQGSLRKPLNGGRKGGGIQKSKRRTTLEEFIKQEENLNAEQNQGQSGLKTSDKNVSNCDCEVLKRSLLAPAPINLPQLWPLPSIDKKVTPPSPHGVHYTFQKTQAERMKRKTFLPYRPRLLGCLGYPPH
ncbi:hypothetical protein L7F22_026487 [Adiantum nelumboides]|nr:hypothetical protein [Adiantum nelumboides]